MFFSSRRRHTRCSRDWSSDVCSSDLAQHSPFHSEVAPVPRPRSPSWSTPGRRRMNQEAHARAKQLVAQERVEGISQAERDWLTAHLQDCTRCAELTRQTDEALRSMRTAAIPLPRGLASRTQFRVRLRAQELREQAPQRRALWFACTLSWALD